MSVSLSEVKRAARAHRAPLAGESAGYLVLALADQVVGSPRQVHSDDIQLAEDGGLRVLRGHAISDRDAESSLRELLEGLLSIASSGSAALSRAARPREPSGLAALVAELETALIPVNRAAARRALARLHRETVRALASGVLPEETSPSAPRVRSSPPPLPVVAAKAVVPQAEREPELEMSGNEFAELSLEELEIDSLDEEADALTVALDVRVLPVEPEPDALTVALDVRPPLAALEAESEPAPPVALPEEACTRPEPIVLRRSQRPPPLPPPAIDSQESERAAEQCMPRTPTLGSLAAELPQLGREVIAELERARSADDAARVLAAAAELGTEPMPEVRPLDPAVSIVPGRRSDVRELLAGFQVAEVDANPGLCRAIKELADLDLTPAPFTALMRKSGS